MIRSVLVRRVADRNSEIPTDLIKKAVDTIFEEMSAALERGERIEFRGFGAFFFQTSQAAYWAQSSDRRKRQC